MSRHPRLPVKVHLLLVLDEQATLIRKRAPVLAGLVGRQLELDGTATVVTHRDIAKPVIDRAAEPGDL